MKKQKTERWWCVKSPEGLLFSDTARKNRQEVIHQAHGGYEVVPIEVREVKEK